MARKDFEFSSGENEGRSGFTRRDFLRMAGVTGAAALLGTGSSWRGKAETRKGGSLQAVVQHGLDSFNQTKTGWMAEPTWAIHEPLISRDWDNQYAPGLAQSWQFSEGGTKLTLKLREGVEFHDGTKFDADVIKWYFEEFMGGNTQYIIDPIGKVKTPGSHEVVLELKWPYVNLLYNLSNAYGGVVPSPTAVKEVGKENYGVDTVVGTGPFKVSERVGNSEILLERFEKYDWGPPWSENGGPAYLDQVRYKVIPEDVARVAELETGGVDAVVTGVPTIKLSQFEQDPNIDVISGPDRQVSWIAFNNDEEKSPLVGGSLKMRKALSLAIDREVIHQGVYDGTGQINGTYLPPMVPAYDIPEKHWHKYDPQKAKDLLQEAGWTDSDGDGIREKGGEKLKLKTIMVNRTKDRRTGVILKELYQKVGVELQLVQMDENALTSAQKSGEWDLCVEDYVWDNADILQWFFCSSQLPYPNWFGVSDPKLDEMIEEVAMRQPTVEERTEKFKEAHIYLLDEIVPAAPLHTRVLLQAVRKRVNGWKYKLLNRPMLNVWKEE